MFFPCFGGYILVLLFYRIRRKLWFNHAVGTAATGRNCTARRFVSGANDLWSGKSAGMSWLFGLL